MQADTVMREAANILTMDGADQLEAMLYAATHSSGLPTLGMGYQQARRAQQERAAYDREHRRAAVVIGQGLGYGLSYRAGGTVALNRVNRMNNIGKGKVGDRLSDLKTVAKGDVPVRHQTRVDLANGQYTRIDQGTLRQKGIVEAKYRTGRHEKLKGAQLQAQKEYGPLYRHDMWGPKDVRRMSGAGAVGAVLGPQAADGYRTRR